MKIRKAAIIIPVLALILALAGGFGLFWRFFVFTAAVLLLSYLWTWFSSRNIEGTVETSAGYFKIGESFRESFVVINNGRLPTSTIEVCEETDIPGYENTAAMMLPPESSFSWSKIITCNRRGRYTMGTLDIMVTDPLGLFSIKRRTGAVRKIIVYPEIKELPYFQSVPRQEPGASPRRWLTSELTANAARVREYTSGDSLRHIHWASTAHTGGLMVKEFDPDRSNIACKNVWILPDMHYSAAAGEKDETMEDYSVMTAASLARRYVDDDKPVGLLATGERSYLIPPRGGEQHLRRILQALAEMRASGSYSIDRLLTVEMRQFDAGSVVIIITSSDNRRIIEPVRRMISRGMIVMVILLDSLSFGGDMNASNLAHILMSSGTTVYIIKQGQDIVRALDSRMRMAFKQ